MPEHVSPKMSKLDAATVAALRAVEDVTAFTPDYAVHPGETLLEWLKEIGWTQADLAYRAGVSTKYVSRVCRGKAAITARTALAFQRVCRISGHTLLRLQADYDWFVATHPVLVSDSGVA